VIWGYFHTYKIIARHNKSLLDWIKHVNPFLEGLVDIKHKDKMTKAENSRTTTRLKSENRDDTKTHLLNGQPVTSFRPTTQLCGTIT
jgi:hypothetical protein